MVEVDRLGGIFMEDKSTFIFAKPEVKDNDSVQFSKVIVMLIIIMNIWFTIAVLRVFTITGVEPTSLVVAFFGFTTGELWLTATIKKTKVNKQRRDEIYANTEIGLDKENNK